MTSSSIVQLPPLPTYNMAEYGFTVLRGLKSCFCLPFWWLTLRFDCGIISAVGRVTQTLLILSHWPSFLLVFPMHVFFLLFNNLYIYLSIRVITVLCSYYHTSTSSYLTFSIMFDQRQKDIDSDVTYYLSGASWELVIRQALPKRQWFEWIQITSLVFLGFVETVEQMLREPS